MTGRRQGVALAGVVAAGLALRLWAFGGVTAAHLGDDTRYVTVAQNLANGHAPEGEAEWFGARVVFLWPVAALFRMFGAGDVTAVAWPLAISLLAVVAAFLVGREIASPRAGLIAAGIVAAAPLEVLLATRLRPDAVMPAFVALAVWAALRLRRSPAPARWAVAAGALLGLAWSAREMAVVMASVVIVAAGRRAGRPRLVVAGAAGFAGVVAAAAGALWVAGGDPLMPLTGTAGASEARNPVTAWSWGDSLLRWTAAGVADPRSVAFLAAAVIVAAAVVLAVRRDRRAVLPAVWAAWGAVYLEVVALVNLTPSPRFLALVSVPLAVCVALAVEAFPRPAAAGAAVAGLAAVATVTALNPVPGREHRGDDVVLLNRVVGLMRDLPAGPVLAEDHTWWTKANLYLARDRLAVPRADDPAFLDAAGRAARSRLEPLPDVAAFRGGYVLVGPVNPRSGWPRNWSAARRAIRAGVPWHDLVLVARSGRAYVYRWPASTPARAGRSSGPTGR